MLLILLLQTVYCGTITQPQGMAAIWNSVANANVAAQYIFNFILDTYLQQDSQLDVVFPHQYISGLVSGTLVCSPSCSISGNTITFNFTGEVHNGTLQTISVQPILNPSKQGGTGNFILRTRRGTNVIDENLIFGLIGIADKIQTMVFGNVNLSPWGSYYAGAYTSYILTFKTQLTYTQNTFLMFTVPQTFQLEFFPVCSAYAVNGVTLGGQLLCSLVNGTNTVMISGIQGQVTGQQEYGLTISMRNPYAAGTSDTFSIGLYKEGTQMMYESVSGITGTTIYAAQLINVTMTQTYPNFINSENRIMDYKVKFTPAFPIPAGSHIKLIFPAYMQIIQPSDFGQSNQFQMHYVDYGLEDTDNYQVAYQYVSTIANYLNIINFKGMTMSNEISVNVRVINPTVSGYTTPLKIYVYQDDLEYYLLQSDVLYAKATISATTSGNQSVPTPATPVYYTIPRSGFFPNYNDISSAPTTLLADKTLITQLFFNYDPTQSIPPDSYIKIVVPSGFTIVSTLTNTNCAYACFAAATIVTQSLTCTVTQQTILMQLSASIGLDIISYPQNQKVAPTNQFQLRLLNALYTPGLNGTYFFDITVMDQNQASVYDSFSMPVVVQPNTLQVYSISHIPSTTNFKSILDIQFTTMLAIPSAQKIYRATDLRGWIEIQFSVSATEWTSDLGTGLSDGTSIPCYGIQNMVPYEGNSINCTLYLGSAAQYAKIVINNFKAIASNTKVRFMISGVVNPSSSITYKYIFKIFQQQNRVYTLLNTISATSIAGMLTTTVPTATTCSNVPQYTENRVGFVFDISIQPCFTSNINANSYIVVRLPTYDIGFIQFINTVTCAISSVQVYCIPFVGSDFILIITPAQTLVTSSNPLIQIYNLQWPRYQQDFTTYALVVYVLSPALSFLQHIRHTTLTNCVPSRFDSINSLVPNKGLGFVDASYQFTFTPQSDIPANSMIVLEFPTFYDFLSGATQPTFTVSGLSNLQQNNVSITVNVRLIKITGFDYFKKGNSFTILATGVQNSQSYTSAIGFNVYVLYFSKYVLQQSGFYQFSFTSAYVAGTMVINLITASILNAAEKADYSIQFTPQNDIPLGALIKITFPFTNYKVLPTSPVCFLNGGMTSYQSCTLNGNTFIVQTAERYSSGDGTIEFKVLDVVNPDQGVTDGFYIETQFSGVSLDVTDNSTFNGRTFTSTAKTNLITVKSITFGPQNEGEEATYNISIISYSSMNSTSQIVFKFPIQYDANLGKNIQCQVFGGIIGAYYTWKISNRQLYFYGFSSYTPQVANPIQITIYGIVNPNYDSSGSSTDYFKIYIGQTGSKDYQESNSEAAQFTFQAAPGWSPLLSLTVENYYVRWNSTYNFTFNTSSNIPKQSTSGAILFDFPSQFEIPDGQVSCNCSTAFATALKCSAYRNKITVQGNYDDFTGIMYVTLESLLNPLEQGSSDFFYVRTYDGLNSIIIQRNFANLDPYKYLYIYPGPLIQVNNNQAIYVDRGTQVLFIPVTVESPCVLNLQLNPSALTFSIFPSIINIPIGTTSTYFNISIPQQLTEGQQTIYWSLDNELDPLLYTPVKRTIVYITANKSTPITQTSILSVPILGQSLLTVYSFANPPDAQLNLTLYLQEAYYGLQLNTNLIIVQPGQTEIGFNLIYNTSINVNGSQIQLGYVTLSLTGINSDIYTIQSKTVPFNIISQDTVAPQWNLYMVSSITKTSVTFTVQLNEPVMLYYLVSLNGTIFPGLSQFKSQRIDYNSTLSQYGYKVIYYANTNYSIKVSGLLSGTNYAIYLSVVDRGYNNGSNQTLYFQTSQRPNSCYFSLIFNQRELSADFITNVSTILSNILGIDSYYIQQKKYYFNQTSRLLQNSFSTVYDQVKSYLDLELASVPYLEQFPDPITVVVQIRNKTKLINAQLPTLNLTEQITAFTFTSYIPQFVTKPNIVYIDYQICGIVVQLSNYGFGYAVAVVFQGQKDIPSPFQIMNSLDYNNRPTPGGYTEISKPYEDFIINIDGLNSETDYYIYVVAGSVQFRNPDLMLQKDIYIDRIISFQAPQPPTLNIKQGYIIALILILLI